MRKRTHMYVSMVPQHTDRDETYLALLSTGSATGRINASKEIKFRSSLQSSALEKPIYQVQSLLRFCLTHHVTSPHDSRI